ncbi:hypothetical protein ACSQ67_009064 [Phaseolus vulgaris]
MTRLVLLLFFLASGLSLSVSQFQCDSPEFQENGNFSYGCIEAKVTSNCSYWVIIYANSLPNITGENLGIEFGDHNGNKVSESKLRILRSSLEQGFIDIFQITGACLSRICFVSVRRYGEKEDWRPEMVKIQGMKYTTPFTIAFKFSDHPTHTWYGHNWCRSKIHRRLDPKDFRLRNGFILLNHG